MVFKVGAHVELINDYERFPAGTQGDIFADRGDGTTLVIIPGVDRVLEIPEAKMATLFKEVEL